jgi:hypothetical protein
MITERNLRATSRATIVLALTAAVVLGSSVSAHRRDELLQAARISIEPHRVELELDLTPGIAIAEAIIIDIDRNRDGSVSPDEKSSYVRGVLASIELDVDHDRLQMESVASSFPGLDAFRRGEGSIRLQFVARLPRLSAGGHGLSFRNTYRRDVGVYLANALVPTDDQIAIAAQRRDIEQRDLTIDFVLRAPASSTPVWLLSIACASVLATLLMKPRVCR